MQSEKIDWFLELMWPSMVSPSENVKYQREIIIYWTPV